MLGGVQGAPDVLVAAAAARGVFMLGESIIYIARYQGWRGGGGSSCLEMNLVLVSPALLMT